MSEQMRKEFEGWIDSLSFEELNDIDENTAWVAWQASRAAVIVRLPQELKFPNVTKKLVYVTHIKQAISKAGVRYK